MWWQIAAMLVAVGLLAVPELLRLPETASNLVHSAAAVGGSFAFVAASEILRGLRYVAAACGLVIAGGVFVVGAPMPALAVVVVGGLAMAALSLGGADTRRPYGGGWRSLLRRS